MKIAFISALSVLAAVSPVAGRRIQGDPGHTKGQITIELYPEKAPDTVKNFLPMWMQAFTTAPFFTGSSQFHDPGRGFTPDMQQKPTRAPIKIESDNGLKNLRGTLRWPGPRTRTAQPPVLHQQRGQRLFEFHCKDEPGMGLCRVRKGRSGDGGRG